jgi:hypothetical protein
MRRLPRSSAILGFAAFPQAAQGPALSLELPAVLVFGIDLPGRPPYRQLFAESRDLRGDRGRGPTVSMGRTALEHRLPVIDWFHRFPLQTPLPIVPAKTAESAKTIGYTSILPKF